MAQEIFDKVEALIQEIQVANPTGKEEIEAFRIQYLGSKNVIKPIFGEIRNIPNERKKEFGQKVNEAKQAAEAKFEALQTSLEQAHAEDLMKGIDLSAPGEPMPVGSHHPVSITMNRIIDIFERIGFTVEEEREIEDDWHNFTAMNTPEDHPARDMQDTYYLKDSTVTYCVRTHLLFKLGV